MFEKLKKLDHIFSTSTEDRRREAREDLVDGVATISSQQYPLKNWSASGFCVGPCMIAPKPGDRLDVTFSIPLADRKLEFSCRVGVMRYDKVQREFSGVFFNLTNQFKTLSTSILKSFRPSDTVRICWKTSNRRYAGNSRIAQTAAAQLGTDARVCMIARASRTA